MVVVVMGPAGAGKTTVGAALAAHLGWRFIDADDYHAPSSVAKMAAGRPLTDRDRSGWLGKLRQLIVDSLERREHLVLACSALTRAHREALAGGLRRVRFLYLKTNRAVLKDRLASRPGHFAGPALLDSQLATIEEPLPDEALVVDATADIDTIVGHVRLEFGL